MKKLERGDHCEQRKLNIWNVKGGPLKFGESSNLEDKGGPLAIRTTGPEIHKGGPLRWRKK